MTADHEIEASPCKHLGLGAYTCSVSPWAVHLSSGNMVITEQEGELKKEPGGAGLNHMSDAVRTSGNPREDQAVGEAEGQAVSPSLAFRGNYDLLMADIAALPWESELSQGSPQMCSAHKYAVGNS